MSDVLAGLMLESYPVGNLGWRSLRQQFSPSDGQPTKFPAKPRNQRTGHFDHCRSSGRDVDRRNSRGVIPTVARNWRVNALWSE